MGIFSSIKDKIFGHKPTATEVGASLGAAVAEAVPVAQAEVAAATPVVDKPVDVVVVLKDLAAANGSDLNWQTSIVDLMKLVGIDSSYDNRKELATELGNTHYSGSAEDNITLHKQVMRALAENGGHVPPEFLD